MVEVAEVFDVVIGRVAAGADAFQDLTAEFFDYGRVAGEFVEEKGQSSRGGVASCEEDVDELVTDHRFVTGEVCERT